MAEIMVALSSDDQTISVPLATVFGTGIARIEQTVTSEDPEIPNEITCTLTNGQQSVFYIKNGKDGFSPSITIEQGAEGYSITVTDEEGSHEYSIIVDSTLDAESANPIQNQAVATAISDLLAVVATKASLDDTVHLTAQTLTAEQKSQARTNIGSASQSALEDVQDDVADLIINHRLDYNELDTRISNTRTDLNTETNRATSAENTLSGRITANTTAISSESSRAQSEEARIEGLTANTVKYTEQTLNDFQQRQARTNIGAGSQSSVNDAMDMVISLRRALYDETDRATQAESSISASIPTSAQISALAPVQSVNGLTGTVTISAEGLSEDAKNALIDCFRHVAWIDSDGTQYVNALISALYELQSITAVYTQSGAVYDTDSLDDLKADLVVTANYKGGTTETVTAYTLSGTLEEGTSTITVSYGGKTTTFNVTVTARTVSVESGAINYNDGNEEANVKRARTDYIPATNKVFKVSAYANSNSTNTVSYAIRYYDANHTFIGTSNAHKTVPKATDSGGHYLVKDWLAGDGTEYTDNSTLTGVMAYIRLVFRDTSESTITDVSGTVTVDGIQYVIDYE